MLCPSCDNTQLSMSSRQGVEIDYCPKCRGVWLDRGELDKIIEREATGPQATNRQQHSSQHSGYDNGSGRQDSGHDSKYGNGSRKKGFWGEIFD